MRPILMKGHERPLTFLLYSRDGDLLFSCAKDHTPTVWLADNGERLGTYRGHNGAVWSCDVSRDSARLITGSTDQIARLWDVPSPSPSRSASPPAPSSSPSRTGSPSLPPTRFTCHPSSVQVRRIARDIEDQTKGSVLVITVPQGRINRAIWGPLNKTIITAGEDATVRIWDSAWKTSGGVR